MSRRSNSRKGHARRLRREGTGSPVKYGSAMVKRPIEDENVVRASPERHASGLFFVATGIEYGHKRLLRNIDFADRFHPLLALTLLGPQFLLA